MTVERTKMIQERTWTVDSDQSGGSLSPEHSHHTGRPPEEHQGQAGGEQEGLGSLTTRIRQIINSPSLINMTCHFQNAL